MNATTLTLFSLRHSSNGEAYIARDTAAILDATDIETYHYVTGNGLRLSICRNATRELCKQLAADIRAAFPTARVRVVKGGVTVNPSDTMHAAWQFLGDAWAEMARQGASHSEMVSDVINQPAYRAFQVSQ